MDICWRPRQRMQENQNKGWMEQGTHDWDSGFWHSISVYGLLLLATASLYDFFGKSGATIQTWCYYPEVIQRFSSFNMCFIVTGNVSIRFIKLLFPCHLSSHFGSCSLWGRDLSSRISAWYAISESILSGLVNKSLAFVYHLDILGVQH